MTMEQIWATLDTITYKPGYEVSAYRQMTYGGVLFIFNALVRDVTNQEKLVPIVQKMQVLEYELETPEHVIRHVKRGWKIFESHEFDEWYRIAGVPLVEPHPDQLKNFLLKEEI